MQMKITAFGGTDTGKKRANNEDAYLLNDELGLYAVADGVGGNEGGEVASRITVETLASSVHDFLDEKERTPPSGFSRALDPSLLALQQAVALANRNIRRERERNSALSDMGTTLTALLFRDNQAFLAHIGDSRAYLLRAGTFKQLSLDHSFVGERVRAGLFTPEQAKTSPYRHIITRAMGMEDEVRADVAAHEVRQGDRFLLCTDGLTEMVDDGELGRILAGSEPGEAVEKLIAAANDAGGVDNITAVVVWVLEV